VIITAGQVESDLFIEAVKDEEVEGPETLTLDLDPEAPLVPGPNGQAVVTIEDTPYSQWAFSTFGLVPLNGPRDDFDGDLVDNVTEYAWSTIGDSFSSRPILDARRENGLLRIDAPHSSLPFDVLMIPESSYDLKNWSPDGIITLPDGFAVPVTEQSRFLRLGFELAP
jgi:hypothetical protein